MNIHTHKYNKLAKTPNAKSPAPFLLCLTFEERAKPEVAANGVVLGLISGLFCLM